MQVSREGNKKRRKTKLRRKVATAATAEHEQAGSHCGVNECRGGERMEEREQGSKCPHCGKNTRLGNFCEHCGEKMAEICDCWVFGKQYNCRQNICPGLEVKLMTK